MPAWPMQSPATVTVAIPSMSVVPGSGSAIGSQRNCASGPCIGSGAVSQSGRVLASNRVPWRTDGRIR